jgi:hypothetical protein
MINSREFLEKKSIISINENKLVLFYSSCPDEILPTEKNITRAYTILGFNVFEALPTQNRIKISQINQTNPSLGSGTTARIA